MSNTFNSIKDSFSEKEHFHYSCTYNSYTSDLALDLLDDFEKFINSKKFSSNSIRKVNTFFEEVLNPMPAFNDLTLDTGESFLKIYLKKKTLTFYLSKDKHGNSEQMNDCIQCIDLINSLVNNSDKQKVMGEVYEGFHDKNLLFSPLALLNMSRTANEVIHFNFVNTSDTHFKAELIVNFNMDEIF